MHRRTLTSQSCLGLCWAAIALKKWNKINKIVHMAHWHLIISCAKLQTKNWIVFLVLPCSPGRWLLQRTMLCAGWWDTWGGKGGIRQGASIPTSPGPCISTKLWNHYHSATHLSTQTPSDIPINPVSPESHIFLQSHLWVWQPPFFSLVSCQIINVALCLCFPGS